MDWDKKTHIILAVACIAMAVIIFLFSSACCIHFIRKKKKTPQIPDAEKGAALFSKFGSLRMPSNKGSVPLIEYKALEKGTQNFVDDNLLGKGGFGLVYKATMDDNSEVAVKKLDCATEDAKREFQTEVNLLSKFRHPNIISLVGYGVHEDMGFIVYELMSNGSLEDLLHGLEYLHEFCKPLVIHRDLKSSNILLDSNFHAKAMPQLTNRDMLPNIVDPVIKDTIDEKYLFQVAAVAVLCVQPEPSYRPLITDIVHSLIPLVPVELGGTLRTNVGW
ncbi:Probable receptor-like protein kinase At1g80640 [Linum perenne]